MSSPSSARRWFSERTVLAIHEAQVAEHGGAKGIRDAKLLASALARPRNAAAYSRATVPELAVLYALGIIRNHPFLDGNKRTATVLLETFLNVHGYELRASDGELLDTIRQLAAGAMSERTFKGWVKLHSRRKSRA